MTASGEVLALALVELRSQRFRLLDGKLVHDGEEIILKIFEASNESLLIMLISQHALKLPGVVTGPGFGQIVNTVFSEADPRVPIEGIRQYAIEFVSVPNDLR